MANWISGRESHYLDAIIRGDKRYEGRLNKGKFAEYRVGDTVTLRRDIRDESGNLRDGELEATVRISQIFRFSSFKTMMHELPYTEIIPDARDESDAASRYDAFYSHEDQGKYGVVAIKVEVVI
jgi:ASC-1-like (ASCH) protein